LAYAIRYRHHDALARVHGPIFALARIIPRREPLHEFFRIRASREVRSMSIYIKSDGGETHDHDIKRNKHPALGPVCLGVGRNVVDEEARADEEDDFEQI
jgi:hypothetical protein